jgi:lipopolysaccharide assembly protein A
MKSIVWLVQWLLKAALFFTLFAFALNNQGDATVRFFFGYQWTAPMVLVVLITFTAGLLLGVLGMVPRWWRQRRAADRARKLMDSPVPAASPSADPSPGSIPHGL